MTENVIENVIAWLYVPAIRPDLFAKAANTADGVVVDLEDAVHPTAKETARTNLAGLAHLGSTKPVVIRVNPVGSSDFFLDIAAVTPLVESGVVRAIRIPKVASADHVRQAAAATGHWSIRRRLICLLEDARGVANAPEIAREESVHSIMLGEADLRVDLGLPRGHDGENGLLLARQSIVLASRAAGRPSPTASVFPNLTDLAGLRDSSLRLSHMGFGGRSCLHPSQIEAVREAFRPTGEDVEWARSVAHAAASMDLHGSAAVALADGSFVDPAIVKQAEIILARSGEDAR